MAKKISLVLFTGSFPYYSPNALTEISFLQNEVQYLANAFNPIIIVPNLIFDDKVSLPGNVEIETSYSEAVRKAQTKNRIFQIFRSSLFFKEVCTHPEFWFRPKMIRKLATRALIVLTTQDWVLELIKIRALDPENTIFYTYWLKDSTLGIGLVKKKHPGVRVVSRAHRGDLYAEQRPFKYFPYRPRTLHLLDRLFLISDHGKSYISKAYPWISDRCEVSRLGVKDTNSMNIGSSDGVLRIVSCSSFTPQKRIHLLISGISQVARERPDNKIEWNHFGDGPLQEKIMVDASQCLPGNVSWRFHGNLPNKDIIKYYRENPVDIFVNVSSSEGIPVSIMEASCSGIPILATAVGGTPEIVSDLNGKLLSADPSPDEISKGILHFLDHPQFSTQARKFSRQTWQQDYDGDKNYPDFINRLISLV